MLQTVANKARRAIRKVRGDWRKHPTADVVACCPVGEDVVWRIVIETVAHEGASESAQYDPVINGAYEDAKSASDFERIEQSVVPKDELELTCYGPAHELLEINPILFEDQIIPCDGLLKRRVTYSIRLSAQTQAFTLEVVHGDKKGKLVIGFAQWCTYVNDARHLRRDAWYQPDYNCWLALHPQLPAIQDEPLADLLMSDATPGDAALVDDVMVQTAWEEVLAADRAVAENAQAQLPLSHIAVQGEGIQLAPTAIERIAHVLQSSPDALMVYTDSDAIDRFGRRVKPLFKPDFSPEYLRAVDYIGGFVVVRRDVYDAVAQRSDGSVTSQVAPYECALVAAQLADERGGEIVHIPEVLFHESDSSHVTDRFRKQPSVPPICPVIPGNPAVDIVIPSKDHGDVLETCVTSILEKATYSNYRIIVVENNSTEPETFALYNEFMKRDARVTVVQAESSGDFNYSRLINFGVAQGSNPYLLLLNNDTEVIEPNFIQYMLESLLNSHVGVVGAKLFFKDGLVQHVGMLIGPDGTVVHVSADEEDSWSGYMGRSVFTTNVSAVTGACQMVARVAFDEVGGYSEQFAVGYNDADFCCKVTRAGKRIVMQPAAKLYHYEFTSRGREENDPVKLERWRKERDLFQRTWPQYFESGDPFNNPNLDKNSRYFSLPE